MKKYSTLKKLIKTFRILSLGISVLFHPLLLPTYIFILVGYFSPLAFFPLNTEEGRTFLVGLVFLSTFFLPFLLLTLYIMLLNKHWTIKSFIMENTKERVFPFLVIGAFYSVILYFVRITPKLNEVIFIIIMSITVSVIIVAFISNFWKISAHAVGISGMIGILGVINNKIPDATLFYPILILIVVAGFLMSARLYLNAHNPPQIAAGALLGLLISMAGYYYI